MGNAIIKLSRGNQDWYLEWSNNVDAPSDTGLPLALFIERYKAFNTNEHPLTLIERLSRVEERGHSYKNEKMTVDDIIKGYNRAGFDETYLTVDEIIDIYCVARRYPKKGEGIKHPSELDTV